MTLRDGKKPHDNIIKITLLFRILKGSMKKVPGKPSQTRKQDSQPNNGLRSWESRCQPQIQMQWIRTPIDYDHIPISGIRKEH
jgi:hypothetical protein